MPSAHRCARPDPRAAGLYARLEIDIGGFGLVSPLVLALVHRGYVAAAAAWHLSGGASVALRFDLAGLALLIPTTLMGGTLPVLTRAFMGADRAALKHSLGRLYGLNTLGAVLGTALAGFFLIEWVGIRASLWGTALVNLLIGASALRLPDPGAAGSPAGPVSEPEVHPSAPLLRRIALILLALTAFASLLDEIAWTRVLVMIVGGSTYAFTLVLLVFLLGIGAGSAVVARRSAPASETAADAAVLTLAVLAARGVAEGSAQHRRLRLRVLGAGSLASVGLAVALAAPRWSTRLIDLGPSIYARQPMNAAAVEDFLAHRGVRQLAFKEGWNATVSVWESGPGRTLKINGKADASDHGDMDTEILLGLAPAAARPGAARALVIGYGSGVTTRVLAGVPGMERVRVVEIEPAVLAMSRFFLHERHRPRPIERIGGG